MISAVWRALRLMRVPNGAAEIDVELTAIEYDLLVVYLFDCAQWYREVTRIFDVNNDTAAPNLTHRAEGFLGVMHEHIEAFADLLFEHPNLLQRSTDFERNWCKAATT